MKIETTRFGTVTLGEEKILNMPFGMLGFPDKQRFVMLQHKENSPFFWYQSVNDPALAFVIISPFLFMPDYEVDIEDILTEMSWNKKSKNNGLELYVVVNIPKGSPEKMTANLIGPILVNNKTRQAVQMVISKSPYIHNFPLIIQNE
ncbi:MAG: flagellar assembly protein FliW [Deltaproteobacteria bacterium]|nr:flagellar assembly protein FliW [Deltaproteobacteria bacterium]